MVVSKASASLPIIDLAPIQNGRASEDDWKSLGEQLAVACRSTGFAYLVNTGIDSYEVDSWFESSRRFFALPAIQKATVRQPEGSTATRGYLEPEKEQGSKITPLSYNEAELKLLGKLGSEKKESFSCHSEAREQNVWPDEEEIPGFRTTCESALDKVLCLRDDLIKILSYTIPGNPLGKLERMHDANRMTLRLAHYLSLPWTELENNDSAWLSPHTDVSTFSLVFQHGVSGLEVEQLDHRTHFVKIDPIPGAIVFNVGDYLERLTNDQFKSTVHRVAPVKPTHGTETEERYSIAFFQFTGPNQDAMIEALPGTWDEDHPKKYSPITAAEYRTFKFSKLVQHPPASDSSS